MIEVRKMKPSCCFKKSILTLMMFAVILSQCIPFVFGAEDAEVPVIQLLEDGTYVTSDGTSLNVPEGMDPFEYISNTQPLENEVESDASVGSFSLASQLMSPASIRNYMLQICDPPYGIGGNPIMDNSGNFWFCTYDNLASQYAFVKFDVQNEEWERYFYNPIHFGYDIAGANFDVDSQGNIWCLGYRKVGSAHYVVLIEFDPVTNAYTEHAFSVYYYPWLSYPTIDDNDVVWIPNNNPYKSGDNRRAVYAYDPHTETVKTYLTPITTNIGKVKIDNYNVPWIPANNRGTIYKVNFSSTTLQSYTYAGTSLGIKQFCFDQDNNIWMTLYNVHLLGYDGEYPLFHYFPSTNSLVHQNVVAYYTSSLELDDEGLLWISDYQTKNLKIYDGTAIIYTIPDLHYTIFNGIDEAMWVYSYQNQYIIKVLRDGMAPRTNIIEAGTLGTNGWYTSEVQVSFDAEDFVDNGNPGAIHETTYSLDEINWVTYYLDRVKESVPLYSDNFDSINPDWVPSSGTWAIADGSYTGKRGSDPIAVTYIYGSENWHEFTIDFKVYLTEYSAKAGLRFLDDEATNTYYELYQIRAGREVRLRKVVNGQQLIDQYIASASSYSWNSIHVEKYGNIIRAGTPNNMLTVTDETSQTGKIGLFTDAYSEVAKFDNFEAYQTLTYEYGPNPFTLDIEGINTISYYSVDKAGNVEQPQSSEIKIDYVAPETSHSLTGNLGENGWYTSDVTVSLAAEDETSGISATFYSVDGGDFQEGNSLIITVPGEHTVEYYSVDNARNTETTKTASVKINTPPVADAGGPYIGFEGTELTLISQSFDPDGYIASYHWDLDGDGEHDDSIEANPIVVFADETTLTIGLLVVDDLGAENSCITTITILNMAPTVEIVSNLEPNEGDVVSFEGLFTDPGTLDTHTIGWDFGDGTTETGTLTPTHVYADNGIYTVTLTVTDDDGGVGEDTLSLTVENVAPTVYAGEDQVTDETVSVSFLGTASDPGSADILTFEWDFDYDGINFDVEATGETATYTWNDDWVCVVALRVTDDDGASTIDALNVQVMNVAPSTIVGTDQTCGEGDIINFEGQASDPSPEDTLTYSWDFGDGSTASGTLTPTHAYGDNGVYTVSLTVKDDDGGTTTDTLTVTVSNVVPVLSEITATLDPVQVDSIIVASATFTDTGILDTHTSVWDWGDGITTEAQISETGGCGDASGNHAYASAGIYTVTLTITDDDGDLDYKEFRYVVVYDPSEGFVTGGGWINSPAGAYALDPELTGKATFGFVSKYKKGATVPTGNTEFIFHAGNLEFHSTSYDWLVIAGNNAKYTGTGTIKGLEGEYAFMLTATDGDSKDNPDLFRIKIWNKNTGEIIYDNRMDLEDDKYGGTAISGGSIIVHKPKK